MTDSMSSLLHRRQFIQLGAAGLAASLALPKLAWANIPGDSRFVMVILRGAMDGLHALPPYADADYRRLRPNIAVDAPHAGTGTIDLNGYFGLHKGFAKIAPLYQQGELSFVPAATTQYRKRSHFDGQNMLENGSGKPYGARDGWLNRAISGLNPGDKRMGLALGVSVPLILQGDAHVQSWADSRLPKADEEFLQQLEHIYQGDPLFHKSYRDAQGALTPDVAMDEMSGGNRAAKQILLSAQAAADLLAQANGPRIAVMEMNGWDTHFAQERRLTALFEQLSDIILALKTGLGSGWQKTMVLVVSEFGRTAAQNANNGTDHGTGGLAILAGGAVNGGRILGEWPGLSEKALLDGRDVMPVNSYEAIFKTILAAHMGVSHDFVEDKVFPNSRHIALIPQLLKA